MFDCKLYELWVHELASGINCRGTSVSYNAKARGHVRAIGASSAAGAADSQSGVSSTQDTGTVNNTNYSLRSNVRASNKSSALRLVACKLDELLGDPNEHVCAWRHASGDLRDAVQHV